MGEVSDKRIEAAKVAVWLMKLFYEGTKSHSLSDKEFVTYMELQFRVFQYLKDEKAKSSDIL